MKVIWLSHILALSVPDEDYLTFTYFGLSVPDEGVTISLHNFVGKVIITFDQDKKITGTNLFTITFV
jgi:hypothetical protein